MCAHMWVSSVSVLTRAGCDLEWQTEMKIGFKCWSSFLGRIHLVERIGDGAPCVGAVVMPIKGQWLWSGFQAV